MRNLLQDIRYALRQLRLSPTFTLTAVLTLAIGIGATTAIFTLIHSIMLKSLPVADPAQLYRIGDNGECCYEGWEGDDWSLFSYPLYQRLVENAPEFEETTAFQASPRIYGTRHAERDREARPLRSEFITGSYFHVFGIGAYQGRVITDADDKQSAPPVAVMSFHTWQQSYGSDPKLVGSTFFIEGKPVTLIGIAPPGFFGETLRSNPPDFWLPIQQESMLDGANAVMKINQSQWLYAVGRLKPGANTDALPGRLTTVLRRWLETEDEIPANFKPLVAPTIPNKYIKMAPAGSGVETMKANYGENLRLLLMACGTVLLIACANIANLLLARGSARRSQTAMRMALGATSTRVVRQQLTEAVLLSLIGGLGGIAIAFFGARIMLALTFRSGSYTPINVAPSWPVLGFGFLLSLVTGLLFGAVPAWFASRSDPAEALRGSNRSTQDNASLPRQLLVIGQAAFSVVLLVCAGLLAVNLRNLQKQDLGFATENRVTVEINPPLNSYTPERLDTLYRTIEDRLLEVPGVQKASLALYSPLSFNNWGEEVAIEGKGDAKIGGNFSTSWDRVSRQFFSTIGQRIVRGRDFSDSDSTGSRPVAIVNEAFVKLYFPNEEPLGKHFGMDVAQYAGTYEIVGVAHDAKYINPDQAVRPMFFVLLEQRLHYDDRLMQRLETQSQFISGIQLLVRGDTTNLEARFRKALGEIDPSLTIISIRATADQVAMNFDQERMVAQLTSVFGIVALLLSAIGLYGLTAYNVTRRTGEIGVRMALGANRTHILQLILRGAFLHVAIGLMIGIPAAYYAGKFIASHMFQVKSWDPLVFGGAILSLGVCAAIASIVPAQRAASTDPVKALRSE
ncbi:MAG TPA: ABC transporter permease [Candidatus Angelobacter sp.]|nr:ABC transporter permease [Candidatus Angelobacter sp.]